MDPLTITALTTLASGLFGFFGQKSANQSNEKNVDKQIDFQREMSNTAHVREVADLRAAGLNPILSAGGGGASTPQGAAAEVDNEMSALSNSASQLAELKQKQQSVDSMTNLNSVQGKKLVSDILVNSSVRKTQEATRRLQLANARSVELENTVKEKSTKVVEDHPKTTGWIDYLRDRVGGAVNSAASVAKSVAPYIK